MKAAVFYEPGLVKVEEHTKPEILADEVLVRVMAAGVCGTDLHIYAGAKGASECYPPVILGHEFCGIVEAVGEEVTHVKVGDHVTIDPNLTCGKCYNCQVGKPHFCENLYATGVTGDGGFAEYAKAKEQQTYVLNPDVPFEEGAMCEPLGCCLHGIDLAGIKTGDTVLVIGGGTIGLIMVQLARMAGASTVIVSEPQENKWAAAKMVGADFVIHPMKQNPNDLKHLGLIRNVNVAIECVGARSSIQDALKYVCQGGHVLLFGITPPDMELPILPYEIFQRELTITASYLNPNTHGRAADLVNSRKLKLAELISDRLELDEIGQAFIIRGRNGKMMIYPNGQDAAR